MVQWKQELEEVVTKVADISALVGLAKNELWPMPLPLGPRDCHPHHSHGSGMLEVVLLYRSMLTTINRTLHVNIAQVDHTDDIDIIYTHGHTSIHASPLPLII